MDYSKTLNLPKTDFPMRANLPKHEPEILGFWADLDAYQQLRKERKGKKKFVLHDGPPYSNGDIHIGHALNKTLKDFVVRSKSMEGYDAAYVPGWDNHGMPIEINVTKLMRQEGRSFTPVELRKRCRQYAREYVELQKKEFIRLGVWGDWEHPYLTMSTEFESKIVEVFGELAEKGYIYRGLRPIHWCPTCGTALALSEIEYQEKESSSIVVAFPLRKDPQGIFAGQDPSSCYVIIWTTTPWTIPANMALVVHPDMEYALVQADGRVYLLADALVEGTMQTINAQSFKRIKKMKGGDLAGIICKHPLFDRDSPMFMAEHVTLDEGTGVVHTAPGHGQEDFEVGIREKLEIFSPVDDKGRFTAQVPEYQGIGVDEVNQLVKDDLQKEGLLLHSSTIEHQYPFCWRCHQPLLFRATVQWFLSVDHLDLRKRSLEIVEKVQWVPGHTENRIYSAVESRPDWCLSRQRIWGVGIPIFYCKKHGHEILSAEAISAVVRLVGEKGSDAWYEVPAEKILPSGFTCPKCGDTEFVKEKDILDVWFDSGSTHRAVLEGREELRWPADLYLEGSDQHRGWFNSSLLIGVATRDAAPYRAVVTHGWVLDGAGQAMHKTKGNVISPLVIYGQHGADVLRLWLCSTDHSNDVRISDEILVRISESYRKIRNTFRFILGNLYDFDPAEHAVEYEKLEEIDRWVLGSLQRLTEMVIRGYDTYQFHEVYHSVYNFCIVKLSAFYLDVLKDRLYVNLPDAPGRRAAQTVLYELISSMVRLMAPVLPFTAEEIWQKLPGREGREKSVHFALFPRQRDEWLDAELASRWEQLLTVRDEVLKALEIVRNRKQIGNSLEAAVDLYVRPEKLRRLLECYREDLKTLFIVSSVTLRDSDRFEALQLHENEALGLVVGVRKADGDKCELCWNYSPTVGESKPHPTLCERCVDMMRQLKIAP
jgi:isoleucyl-tRNA synthetase